MKFKGTTAGIVAALLLAGVCTGTLLLYIGETEKNKELEGQLAELTNKEKRTTVMQRVNAQMEEIANEERRISDEQREAAEHQAQVAEQERQNAEQQRQAAEQQRQNALTAEQRAIEASREAQSERAKAEQQRAEAELSKRVTDTLSYLTLARSLGSNAVKMHFAGNNEMADMLAYLACTFTNRYKGDIYSPTVYQALALTSQDENHWNKHHGSVTDIAFSDNAQDYIVSCSTYGELVKHRFQGGQLVSETLISNPRYDFRDIFIDRDRNIIYAVSRSGHLIVANGKSVKVVEVSLDKLRHIENIGSQLLLFGEQGIAILDSERLTITKAKSLPFKIVFICRYDSTPALFDDRGHMHLVRSIDRIESSRIPVSGQVTAFALSNNQHIKAYGMNDGSIFLFNEKGQMTKLMGHRSRVSKIKLDGMRLYSSSYDGSLNLWFTNLAKIEPITLFTTNGWIINFTFDPKKSSVWTGDQKGNLTCDYVSVSLMTRLLKQHLKRNFTREEWDYYVGRNVPYEKIKSEE